MFSVDPLHLCLGLGPLATYFLALGLVHLGSHPVVTRGTRDFLALAMGLSGLIAAGPMELFLSEAAAQFWGPAVWGIMLGAYGLCTLLLALMMRPRLVIYNVNLQELRPIVEQIAATIDSGVRWAGDAAALPAAGLQFRLEMFPALHNAQLVASGAEVNLLAWRQLERELRSALGARLASSRRIGPLLIAVGATMAIGISAALIVNPSAVQQALAHMLRTRW